MEQKVKSDLSIIIVNWNTRELLLNCLASVARIPGEFEVIVVDNDSMDGSAAAVASMFPNVKIIQSPRNMGYACANMMGLRASIGRYVLFLNSDTLIPSKALPSLIEFLDNNPQVAACGPRLEQKDGAAQAFSFGRDPTLLYIMARACARLGFRAPLHDWETDRVQPVDWISGTCLLVRRAALDQVAGFDERIFMYFEDNDLCLRLRRAGWQIVYYPKVTVVHIGAASPINEALRRKYYDESLRYFYSKHFSVLQRTGLRIMLPLYRWFLC
jgi:N-acetylglucosaminyl-diphospho-decaprenol L-rhamnosyltransferase